MGYFKSIGAPEFFDDMKKAGKIRYKCFSFHGPYDQFEYILNDNDWDMVQIQYNFMDINNQAGTRGLELAGSKGIPVVIMEGLLGGRLAKAPQNVQALYDAFPVKDLPLNGLSAGFAIIRLFLWCFPVAMNLNRLMKTSGFSILWKPAL